MLQFPPKGSHLLPAHFESAPPQRGEARTVRRKADASWFSPEPIFSCWVWQICAFSEREHRLVTLQLPEGLWLRESKWQSCSAALVSLALILMSACNDTERTAGGGQLALGSTLAVNTHYGTRSEVDRRALALLRAAGVHTLRNDLDWEVVEKQPGFYDFSAADQLVEAASALGLRLLFILDYGNRLYGPARAVVDERGRAAFAAFAHAAASRYRGRGFLWEIWNEPNSPFFWGGGGHRPDPMAYAQLVKTAVPALRSADSSATIFAGAVLAFIPEGFTLFGAIPHLTFLEGMFAAGLLTLIDGVTVHFYRDAPPESLAGDVAAVQSLMRRYGDAKPVVSGEWGYSTYDPTTPATGFNFLSAVSLEGQATYLARMMLTNFSLGLPLSVWFKDRDEANASPGNIEHHWGLLAGDLTPKPAYFALRTLNDVAGDGLLAQQLFFGTGVHGVKLVTGHGEVTAIWSESAVQWQLRLLTERTAVIDRDGHDVTHRVIAGDPLFTGPDRGPFYILGQAVVRAEASVREHNL